MPESRTPPRPDPVPSRVTMPLLSLISEQTLDEDYQEAAHRRTARPDRPGGSGRSGRRRRVTGLVVAAFGLLIATAAVQTSQNATVRDAGRAELVAQIEQERTVVADQQDQIAQVRRLTTQVEGSLAGLSQDLASVSARQESLQTATGFVPVTGQGVRVRLDQAPAAAEDAMLRDSDLALMVNAWWSAGAEAISVNGQRLTTASAIRTSGQAIEINGVGLAEPYDVLVVGDRDTLQARFFETSSGLAFADLVSRYDFTFERRNADDLSLPAAPSRLERLRSATSAVPDSDAPRSRNQDQTDQTDQEVQP